MPKIPIWKIRGAWNSNRSRRRFVVVVYRHYSPMQLHSSTSGRILNSCGVLFFFFSSFLVSEKKSLYKKRIKKKTKTFYRVSNTHVQNTFCPPRNRIRVVRFRDRYRFLIARPNDGYRVIRYLRIPTRREASGKTFTYTLGRMCFHPSAYIKCARARARYR